MNQPNFILSMEAILLQGKNKFLRISLFAAEFKLDRALACFWNLTCSLLYGVWLTPWMYPDKMFYQIIFEMFS